MLSARRSASPQINSSVNVTPMVDVMLVLLIIFMIVTPMLNGPEIELVQVRNPVDLPDVDSNDAIIVAITRDNHIFLGTEDVSPGEGLGTRVHDMLAQKTDKRAFLRADKRARYGLVTDVVDILHSQGIVELGLLTEPRTGPTTLW